MLGLNQFGEAVEVTEQSPYDLSHVDKKIPDADFQPVDTKFNPKDTFAEQAANVAQEIDWSRVEGVAKAIEREQKLRNADVLEQYRFQITCEQGGDEISATNVLLNKSLKAGTFGPDFKQNEISNIVYRGNNTDPTRPANSPLDYSGLVPGDRIGSDGNVPNSLPGRRDASNTPGPQMSGYNPQMGRSSVRNALIKKSKPVESWGSSMMLGDFWSDLLNQGEAAALQTVKTELPKLASQYINPPQGSPQYVPPSQASVVQVPGQTYVTGSQTIKSSVDTKMLLIAGAGLAGLVVLLAVLKR